ncbi:MAG: type II toxin-antitoxin system RnlB family antitoxin [Nitrosomonas ureae]
MTPRIRVIGEVALVTANAEFNPLHQLKILTQELETFGFQGHVLFDLLAVNGQAGNRFVKIVFNGHKFDKNSLAIETNVSQSIKDEQNLSFRNDMAFLKASVLSSQEIDDFLRS